MSGRIYFPMLVPPFDEGGIAVGVTGYAFRVVYLQGGHEEPFVKNGRDVEYLVLAILVSGAYSDPFFQRGEGLVVQAEFIIHAALYLQGHRHAYRLFNLLRRLEHGCGFLTGLVEPSLLEQSGYKSIIGGEVETVLLGIQYKRKALSCLDDSRIHGVEIKEALYAIQP